MASYTELLELLKMNPITDGDSTFNIETMLNENWDKIDDAVGLRETLLKDNETKSTPADADSLALVESSSGTTKRVTWSRVKTVLSDLFGLAYAAITHAERHKTDGADPLAPADIGAAAAQHNHSAGDINSGTLPVARGGTGAAALTSGYFLRGNGVNAVTQTAPGTVRTDIGAASRLAGTATLAVASWAGAAAPFTYALAVTGITATDTPHVDRVTGTDSAAAELINEAWALIAGYPVKPQTSAGLITFRASEKPTVAIPIMYEAVRS